MRSDKRKNDRINIARHYFYYPKDKKKRIFCELNNISITGACITSSEKIENEDIIFLNFSGNKDITLKSKAVWKINNQYGLQFLLDSSIEFENVSYIMNNINPILESKKNGH